MSRCPECTAPLPEGGACIDHFHALLALEHEVARDSAEARGGRGEIAHFHAVSAYVLQHPDSMNSTREALDGLLAALAGQFAAPSSLASVRQRVRHGAEGSRRVTRRAGDEVVRWPVESWPMTVVDVVAGGVNGYCGRAAAWARSVVSALSAINRA